MMQPSARIAVSGSTQRSTMRITSSGAGAVSSTHIHLPIVPRYVNRTHLNSHGFTV